MAKRAPSWAWKLAGCALMASLAGCGKARESSRARGPSPLATSYGTETGANATPETNAATEARTSTDPETTSSTETGTGTESGTATMTSMATGAGTTTDTGTESNTATSSATATGTGTAFALITTNCAGCHGDLDLLSTQENCASQINDVVSAGIMPRFSTLAAADKQAILTWTGAFGTTPCTDGILGGTGVPGGPLPQ